jgi:truncated hemoglobin YjbI
MTQNEWIFEVVNSFYDKAKNDILIGYHFRNIPDFNTHIPRISAFWELQLLGKTSRPFEGGAFDVMNVHMPLKIKRGELGRWLLLFRKTLDEKNLPDFSSLKDLWDERLKTFERIFLNSPLLSQN